MRPLLVAVIVVASVSAASALSPQSEAYLRQIGLDPAAADVRAADADGTIQTTYKGDLAEYSLESLASSRKRNGTIAFVTTRNFIRRLKDDFDGTPLLKTGYDPLYLTPEERALVGRKVIANLGG